MNDCIAEANKVTHELVVLGVDHRVAGSMDAVAALTLSREGYRELLPELRRAVGADELVYLATCNRVLFTVISTAPAACLQNEISRWYAQRWGVSRLPEPSEWRLTTGPEAVEHLLRVTCSLESMVVGERQILGQVKEAFFAAREAGTVGPKLTLLFENAFAVAKGVLTETGIGKGKLSIVSMVEAEVLRYCQGREKVRAALVGAGKMIEKVAYILKGLPQVELVFVNRTLDNSRHLSEKFDGTVMGLTDFLANPGRVQVLASSTAAPHTLFDAGFLTRCHDGEKMLAIDLAIPPDIEPEAGKIPGVSLINMETLRLWAEKRREKRNASVKHAEAIVRKGVETILAEWKVRLVGPAIAELTERMASESLDSLETLLSHRLAHLPEEEKNLLRNWMQKLSKQLAMLQVAGMKETAQNCCLKAVTTFLEGVKGQDTSRARQQTH